MATVLLNGQTLSFHFDEVHPDARMNISFSRTLRVPIDGGYYPLPAGLGLFPVYPVQDYREQLPADMLKCGGVMFPMYQSEAMWISFSGRYPMAVKVAAGKINAVTGDGWNASLNATGQDYLVRPDQPWLDGFYAGDGVVSQFVAMPLGQGYTAEEQLTGEAEYGGLQFQVYPMKADHYEAYLEKVKAKLAKRDPLDYVFFSRVSEPRMGFAAGGSIKQEIYEDPYGIAAWDARSTARCFVHVINSSDFKEITGKNPPHPPITKRRYQECGIPWYAYYGGDRRVLSAGEKLRQLKSILHLSRDRQMPLFDNQVIYPGPIEQVDPENPYYVT